MTRRDYVAIARAIREAYPVQPGYTGLELSARIAQTECVANEIARVMRADNKRFDPARFLKECGL